MSFSSVGFAVTARETVDVPEPLVRMTIDFIGVPVDLRPDGQSAIGRLRATPSIAVEQTIAVSVDIGGIKRTANFAALRRRFWRANVVIRSRSCLTIPGIIVERSRRSL